MSKTPIKPISIKEHILHIILVLGTSFVWLPFYLVRVLLKQREIKGMTADEKAEWKKGIKQKYSKDAELLEKALETEPGNMEIVDSITENVHVVGDEGYSHSLILLSIRAFGPTRNSSSASSTTTTNTTNSSLQLDSSHASNDKHACFAAWVMMGVLSHALFVSV